jgi:hypothetical protein
MPHSDQQGQASWSYSFTEVGVDIKDRDKVDEIPTSHHVVETTWSTCLNQLCRRCARFTDESSVNREDPVCTGMPDIAIGKRRACGYLSTSALIYGRHQRVRCALYRNPWRLMRCLDPDWVSSRSSDISCPPQSILDVSTGTTHSACQLAERRQALFSEHCPLSSIQSCRN